MHVRLTKKFAEALDGVDLSRWRVGEVLAVTRHEAELLLAEGWAEPVRDDAVTALSNRPIEAHHMRRSTDVLREIRVRIEEQSQAQRDHRRFEDRV